jgi:hypothetical protein
MRLDHVEVADAVAATIMITIDEWKKEGKPGIPVGDDPNLAIEDMEYDEGEDELQIRLTNGKFYAIRPHQVAPTPDTASVYQPRHLAGQPKG